MNAPPRLQRCIVRFLHSSPSFWPLPRSSHCVARLARTQDHLTMMILERQPNIRRSETSCSYTLGEWVRHTMWPVRFPQGPPQLAGKATCDIVEAQQLVHSAVLKRTMDCVEIRVRHTMSPVRFLQAPQLVTQHVTSWKQSSWCIRLFPNERCLRRDFITAKGTVNCLEIRFQKPRAEVFSKKFSSRKQWRTSQNEFDTQCPLCGSSRLHNSQPNMWHRGRRAVDALGCSQTSSDASGVISFTAAKGMMGCVEVHFYGETSFWEPNPDLQTTNVRNSVRVGFAIDAIPKAAEWSCRHGGRSAEVISKLSCRKSVN